MNDEFGDLWRALDRWRVRRYESKPSWDSYLRFVTEGRGIDASGFQSSRFVLDFVRECLGGRTFVEHLQELRQLRASPLIDWLAGDGVDASWPI